MNKLKKLGLIALISASIASCTAERPKEDVVNSYTLEINGTNYKFKDFNEDGSIDAILTKPSLDVFGTNYRVEFVKPEFQNNLNLLSKGISVQNRYLVPKIMSEDMQISADSLVSKIKRFEEYIK